MGIIGKIKEFITQYWLVFLVFLLLCCLWSITRPRENIQGNRITANSIGNEIGEAENHQQSITDGLSESADQADHIAKGISGIINESQSTGERIQEARGIIEECESILSEIRRTGEIENKKN